MQPPGPSRETLSQDPGHTSSVESRGWVWPCFLSFGAEALSNSCRLSGTWGVHPLCEVFIF